MRGLFLFIFLLTFWLNCYSQERIVSLSPALTEIISYLGEDNRLVGVTTFCRGSLCRGKKKVGGIVNPNVEKIYSLHPDLVVSTDLTPEREIEVLRKLGIRVLVFKLTSLKDIERTTEELGALFKEKNRGKGLIRKIKREAENFLSCFKEKKVLVLISVKPFYCAGSKTYIGEILSISGAKVVPKSEFKPISAEEILKLKPDVVLVVGKEVPSLLRNFGLKVLNFKNSDEILHPSPLLLKGIKDLGREVCRN